MILGIALGGLTALTHSSLQMTHAALWAAGFGAYTFGVNMLYYLHLQDTGLIKASLYYLYNAALFTFLIGLFRLRPEDMRKILYAGLVVSLIGQIVVITFLPEYESGRMIGSFNNPNQLSQWALFTACMIMMVRQGPHRNIKLTTVDLGLIALTLYIQTLALSKSGIICSALLMAGLPFTGFLRTGHKILFVGLGVIVLIYGAFEYDTLATKISTIDDLHNTIARVANIGQEADDSPRGRGYYRLIEYPQYLITGAGEGAYYRFADFSKPIEIHAGLLSMLFCYGVIGFGLFGGFILSVMRRAPPSFWFLLFIVMLGGLTHQNLRFSHFWVFMAVMYGTQAIRPSEPAYSPPASSES